MERSWNEDIHCPTDGTPGHLGRNERLDPRDFVGLSETQELNGQHLRPLLHHTGWPSECVELKMQISPQRRVLLT
jgi:hypothetical protein